VKYLLNGKEKMEQFLKKDKYYAHRTEVVFMGSTVSKNQMKIEMYPELTPGKRYELALDHSIKDDYVLLKGIIQQDDPGELYELHLDKYTFMEVQESDYDVVKDNPERMKEFVRVSIQYIMNNPAMYNAVRRNMQYLQNKQIFEKNSLNKTI
jgi:hypothetical protein